MIKGESSAELRDRVACLVEHFTLGYGGIDKLTEFIASECDESFRAGRQDAVIEQTAIWEARMGEVEALGRQAGFTEGYLRGTASTQAKAHPMAYAIKAEKVEIRNPGADLVDAEEDV